jgi:hypothetical protein
VQVHKAIVISCLQLFGVQVLTYDLFSCYASSVLMAAFSVWRWDSGFPGYLCMDDFVR